MQQRIVVYDPTDQFAIGTLIDGERALSLLHGLGAVTLPIDEHLIGRNAVSGYFYRGWGSGVIYQGMVGRRGCPMLLYAMPDFPRVTWAARIEPIEGREFRGTFRLAMDSGQVGCISGGLRADSGVIEVASFPIDKAGGITIGGECSLNCTMEGYLGLSLYGTSSGCRVMWSAVSQSR